MKKPNMKKSAQKDTSERMDEIFVCLLCVAVNQFDNCHISL